MLKRSRTQENMQYKKILNYSQDKLDILIKKIFRTMSSETRRKIKASVMKNDLTKISEIVNENLTSSSDENRQEFIAEKIFNYIESINKVYSQLKIVDIGGGNGNVLSCLKNKLEENANIKSSKENFICVETLTDWSENYPFDKNNITYKFWENQFIDIPDESVDIVMCMVSLHHMTDQTIENVFYNINRILKKDGRLLIKEHDNSSRETYKYILWEHHLYHILDCAYQKKLINITEYYNSNIYNFKSKLEWQFLLIKNNMCLVERRNRFLDGKFVEDDKNVTQMYWDVYRKFNV